MKKETLKEYQLQAGGSHYPSINPQMQETFARLIVEECVKQIKEKPRGIALTTFQDGIVKGVQERCIKGICEKFGLNYDQYKLRPEHDKIYSPRRTQLDVEK